MGSFTTPTTPASIVFTTKGSTENARAIAGNTSFKIIGFSVGRDGYTTADPTQIIAVNPADTTLTDPIWPSTSLTVSSIAWQSGNTIRYSFSGSPDLSEVQIGMLLSNSGSTNASNDGAFTITNVNDGADYIDVTNPNRSNATDDEGIGATSVTVSSFIGYEQPTPTDLVAVARLDRTVASWALGEIALHFQTVTDAVPANIGLSWIGCLGHFPVLCKTTDTVLVFKITIPLL